MRTSFSIPLVASCLASLAAVSLSGDARAVGEADADGFPSYEERVQHELANRARVAPEIEMEECGAACAEADCYDAMPPLYYERSLNRAARFHAAHQSINNYFAHDSSCTLTEDIGTTYPNTCDGAASCSCVGGQNSCSDGGCTGFSQRIGRFGAGASGEIIASGGGAVGAFYLWLYEFTDDPACNFTQENGHRWLLLKNESSVGFGADGVYVGDFGGSGAPETNKIASGSHWPRSGAVEAWANWYDAAAPQSALVNVDGACTPMTLARGTAENGAYTANLSGAACSRYFFLFKDSTGAIVTFPTTGSLGIGDEGGCPDWSSDRPPTGASCDCVPQCEGKVCGDDACGGSCGNCEGGTTCDANGQCAADAVASSSATGGDGDGDGAGAPGDGDGDGAGTPGDAGPAGPASGSGSGSAANGAAVTGTGSGSGGGDGDGASDGGDDGCGCRTAGARGTSSWALAVGLAFGAASIARRRRDPR